MINDQAYLGDGAAMKKRSTYHASAGAMLSLFMAACLCSQIVVADIPDSYKPVVIEPPFSFGERLIDLTLVIKKAISEGKPILLYMGAQDCPPCRQYEQFLIQHRSEVAAAYEPLMLVEVRSWLKGPQIVFQAGDRRFSLTEFKAVLGDKNKVFTWPYWWLISPDLKQIKQLPQGSSHYLTVDNHNLLLRIDKP